MRLTDRDMKIVRDVALSQILSRDQLIRLGYFDSISRTNARLRPLGDAGYLKVLATPFHAQHLYGVGVRAKELVGERIARLLANRKPSPQFAQHALMVTNVRIALLDRGITIWRFEPQLRHRFTWRGQEYEARPDGLAIQNSQATLVEVDLGHVSPAKFNLKLLAYRAYQASGLFDRTYKLPGFEVLTVTTSGFRKTQLQAIASAPDLSFRCLTFEEFGIEATGGWS